MVTVTAVSAVPSDSDPLARPPSGDAAPDRINHSRHLVAGYPRVLNARITSFLGERIAVADAACLYPDADRACVRFRYLPFYHL
jgi:hypothetical protein